MNAMQPMAKQPLKQRFLWVIQISTMKKINNKWMCASRFLVNCFYDLSYLAEVESRFLNFSIFRGYLLYQSFNILVSLSYKEVQAQKLLKLIFFDNYWHHIYEEEQTCILAYFLNWHSFLLTCMNRQISFPYNLRFGVRKWTKPWLSWVAFQ